MSNTFFTCITGFLITECSDTLSEPLTVSFISASLDKAIVVMSRFQQIPGNSNVISLLYAILTGVLFLVYMRSNVSLGRKKHYDLAVLCKANTLSFITNPNIYNVGSQIRCQEL